MTKTVTSEDRGLTAYGVARRLVYQRAKVRLVRRYLRAHGSELEFTRLWDIEAEGREAKAEAEFLTRVWEAWARDEISEEIGEEAAQRALAGWSENWRALGSELGLGITDAETWARGYARATAAGWAVEAADRVRDAVRCGERGWYRGVNVEFARRALERAKAARREG